MILKFSEKLEPQKLGTNIIQEYLHNSWTYVDKIVKCTSAIIKDSHIEVRCIRLIDNNFINETYSIYEEAYLIDENGKTLESLNRNFSRNDY